jgi:hypothetical protein
MRMTPLLLAACLAPGLAAANDGVASVSAGGITFRKTSAIAMKKEVLNVGHDLISVDYEFVNESASDVEETIVFPLPQYRAVENSSEGYYGQPDGFSIMVDGQPVKFSTTVVALFEGRPVNAALKKLGLTDAQIAFNPAFGDKTGVNPLSARQWEQLSKLGLIGDGAFGTEGPAWEIQVNYVWKQKFPAKQVVRVHHAYRPFVAAGPGMSGLDEGFAKQYCADKAFMQAWNRLSEKNDNSYLAANHVAYILKTGNTWKNGIEDFTLNVIKSNPSELVSLCFPGTFKKIDARTYQVRLKNFHPKADLNVYFGNIDTNDATSNAGVMPALAP